MKYSSLRDFHITSELSSWLTVEDINSLQVCLEDADLRGSRLDLLLKSGDDFELSVSVQLGKDLMRKITEHHVKEMGEEHIRLQALKDRLEEVLGEKVE